LAETLNNLMQIKVKALGHRKNTCHTGCLVGRP